jgi:choline/ethanolamine kinase
MIKQYSGCSGDKIFQIHSCILRLYNTKNKHTAKQLQLIEELSINGIIPEVYYTFNGGRIERFISHGNTVTEYKDTAFNKALAKSIALLHNTDTSLLLAIEPYNIWDKINLSILTTKCPINILSNINDKINKVKTTLEPILANSSHVLSHNDIHGRNLLYDAENNHITLIDFEETAIMHPAYDIANYFCERSWSQNLTLDLLLKKNRYNSAISILKIEISN